MFLYIFFMFIELWVIVIYAKFEDF